MKETNFSYDANQTSSVHAFCNAELVAFDKHNNKALEGCPELPLPLEDDAIFDAVKDGILLWYGFHDTLHLIPS